MMEEQVNIASGKELEAWLEGKPPEWAHILALRSALRVFPLVFTVLEVSGSELPPDRKPGLILESWRSAFIATTVGWGVADNATIEALSLATQGFVRGIQAEEGSQASQALGFGTPAIAAEAAAFTSIVLGDDDPANQSAAAGAEAAAKAAGASDGERLLWQAINFDIGFLRESANDKQMTDDDFDRNANDDVSPEVRAARSLMTLPLWPIDIEGVGATDPSLPRWAAGPLDTFERNAWEEQSSWKLIVDWYRALLPDPPDQKPYQYFGEEASYQLATQPDTFWTVTDDRPPDQIMDEVAKMVGWSPTGLTPPNDEKVRTETPLQSDRPEGDEDHLGRADIAFMLAGRMQQIWDGQSTLPEADDAPSFVVQIDAPWGGGKSTFANYLARILNPHMAGEYDEPWKDDMPKGPLKDWRNKNPWHIVHFNAWQKQHVRPPWWVFYRTLHRQTLSAIWRGQFSRDRHRSRTMPGDRMHLLHGIENALFCLRRWFSEMVWRLWVPGNRVWVITSVVSLLAFVAFWSSGMLELVQPTDDDEGGWRWGGPIAGLLAVLTFARTAFGAFANSLIVGTPDAADNYSLGAEDPLQHFKRHYNAFCRRLRRPILVVVDDLDRCEPDYVTELLTGFQTVVASPRVIILLLGDRDWLEESFAQSNQTMKEIDVGPEHGFGARFVEKVIQLSITLPEMDSPIRRKYLNALLQAVDAEPDSAVSVPVDVRQQIDAMVASTDIDDLDRKVFAQVDTLASDTTGSERATLETYAARQVSLKAATDTQQEEHTRHQLQGLAHVLPPNPRQIKRIINTVTLIGGVARAQFKIRENSTEWRKLARWIVLMIEWPQTWYTLSNKPQLADRMEKEWDGARGGEGSAAKWSQMITANQAAMNLIRFDLDASLTDWPTNEPITTADIERFVLIMPPTNGTSLPLSD